MKPGAYIFGRHLAMSGLAYLGGHQFIVLVPEHPDQFGVLTRDLGDGSLGIVVGAYDVGGRLQSIMFAASDYDTVQRLLKTKDKILAGVKVDRINLNKTIHFNNLDQGLRRILNVAQNYRALQDKKPLKYPDGLLGQLSPTCLNSNSWAQTVVQLAVGPGAVPEHIEGLDLCNENRIDPSYFRSR